MENLDLFAPGAAPAAPRPPSNPPQGLRVKLAPDPAFAARLLIMAGGMADEIDRCFAQHLTNTPKRQRQADSARLDGARLQRTQAALRALADLHSRGEVPAALAALKTKKDVHELTRTIIEHRGGYYDAGCDTGVPALDTAAAKALWALLKPPSAAERAAEELRRKIDALQFANIPGYFPTPAPVVARMIELAEIPEYTGLAICDPEGGSGHILDALRAARPAAQLSTYEQHCTLAEILKGKGYDVLGSDFLEASGTTFDHFLMNPPFERGQDMDHVRHAYGLLSGDGTLVAVMAPSFQFAGTTRAADFRAWLDRVGGIIEPLPPGSFKESGTGVGAVLVKITK